MSSGAMPDQNVDNENTDGTPENHMQSHQSRSSRDLGRNIHLRCVAFRDHAIEICRKHRAFLLSVVLPTFVVALYLLFIATPQFVSEAHFVVRGHSPAPAPPSLATMLQGSSAGQENTFLVADFIKSRDAMQALQRKSGLNDVFARKEGDFFARYPAFFDARDAEHFFRYYKRHVTAVTDDQTGVTKLRVRTFRPEDSQRIAEALLAESEALVNRMNERQKINSTKAAREEVKNIQATLKETERQIALYRNKTALINPERESAPMLKSIGALEELKLTTQMQLSQLKDTAPNSPMIKIYKQHISVLDREIKRAKERITGDDASLVPKIRGFDELITQRELLIKVLGAAMSSLEAAKAQANRQMVYVDVVVQPDLPDWPAYPANILTIVVVFCSLLTLYAMCKMLIMGAHEHSAH